jgi:hypothetical protein
LKLHGQGPEERETHLYSSVSSTIFLPLQEKDRFSVALNNFGGFESAAENYTEFSVVMNRPPKIIVFLAVMCGPPKILYYFR